MSETSKGSDHNSSVLESLTVLANELVNDNSHQNESNTKPIVDKPYSTRLPWGSLKEKQNTIYNKSLLINLKNSNSESHLLICDKPADNSKYFN